MRRPLGLVVALLAVLALVAGWYLVRRRDPGPPGRAASRPHGRGDGAPTRPGLQVATPRASAAQVAPEAGAGVVLDASSLRGRGVVHDRRGRPLGDVRIVASRQGRVVDDTRSDASGRIDVGLGPVPEAPAWVDLQIAAGSHQARRTVLVPARGPAVRPLGVIMIGDEGELIVDVTRAGEPVADATVVVEPAGAAGAASFLARGQTDARGRVHLPARLDGAIDVHAGAAGHGRVSLRVTPCAGEAIGIELPADRSLAVWVVRAGTQEGIAGARIDVGTAPALLPPRATGCLPPLAPVRTDDMGRAVLAGLPAGPLFVQAQAPGHSAASNGIFREPVRVAPDAVDVVLELHRPRMLRFDLRDGGVGIPVDGTTLDLVRYQPMDDEGMDPPVARVERGQLVIGPFPPGFDLGHVVAPDGRWARWQVGAGTDGGAAVAFRRAYDLRVRLRHRDGTPAPGEHLSVALQPRGHRDAQATDERGEVIFPACHGESALVTWIGAAGHPGPDLLRVPLDTDPGLVEAVIDPWVEIVLAVTVEGVATLPDGCRAEVPESSVLDPVGDRTREVPWQGVVVDEERGELRFRWPATPAGRAPAVTLRAPDHPSVTAQPEQGPDDVWRATIGLAAPTTLQLPVTPPAEGGYLLYLEAYDASLGAFVPVRRAGSAQTMRDARAGLHAWRGLEPGRYRVREWRSEVLSSPIEVRAGGPDVAAAFDLTRVVTVTGRVEVPPGEDPALTGVRVVGRRHGSTSVANPVRPDAAGVFRFRAGRGDRLDLVAEHPRLRMSGDPVAVLAGRTEPVLSLVPGAAITFRLDLPAAIEAARPMASRHADSPLEVRLAEEVGHLALARVHHVAPVEGQYRLGLPGPGTWAVRLEKHGFVPTTLQAIDVTDEGRDLGVVHLSRGALLAVRLHAGERPLPLMTSVSATREGEDHYVVSTAEREPGDPPVAHVLGLGPGTFRVVVAPVGGHGGGALFETRVVSDGQTTILLDAQLP